MENKKNQKEMSLQYVGGLSTLRSEWYGISPLTGELVYTTGWIIIFYNINERKQNYYIMNPKSLPYASIAFSNDGKTLLAGESMTKHSNVHHFEYSAEEKCYVKKVFIKTLFHTIEGISISSDCSIFVINGFAQDENNKGIMKYEVYDITKKKSIWQHRLTKKVQSICFNHHEDNSFSILLKDSLLTWSESNNWKGASATLPVGSTTKYIGMIDWEGSWQFILSEDK